MRALGLRFSTSSADIVGGRRLATGDLIATLVFTSLFTDAQAPADLVPAGEFRGGSWRDALHTRSHGSLLWTLRREKLTPQVRKRAQDICIDALVWMIDAKYLRSVSVTTEILARDRLGITVTCIRKNASESEIFSYEQEFSNAA